MCKGMVASLALVLLLSSIAFSDVGQAESFGLNAKDMVALLGGPGSAISGESMMVGQNQVAATPGLDFNIVFQSEMGILNQGAIAVGLSAILGVLQESGLAGEQTQNENGGAVEQHQNWTGNLGQDLTKSNGIGGIIAGQGYTIGQVQVSADRNGISMDVNLSSAVQFNGVVGTKGLDVILQKYIAIGNKPISN